MCNPAQTSLTWVCRRMAVRMCAVAHIRPRPSFLTANGGWDNDARELAGSAARRTRVDGVGGWVCVCVCVLCLTLLSHGCADMRRWAHTLEHAARLNRACTTARWRGGRRWGGGGLRVHPHRGRRCGRRTFSAVAFARSQESCGRTTPRVGDCVSVGWPRRFLHHSTAVTGIFTPARSTVVKKERRQPAGPQSFPRARVRRDEAPA